MLSMLLAPSIRKGLLSRSSPFSIDLLHRATISCARECIMNAQNVIVLLDSPEASVDDPLPAERLPVWWFGVFCESRVCASINAVALADSPSRRLQSFTRQLQCSFLLANMALFAVTYLYLTSQMRGADLSVSSTG